MSSSKEICSPLHSRFNYCNNLPNNSTSMDSIVESDPSGYSTPKFNRSGTFNTAFTSTALTFSWSQNNNEVKEAAKNSQFMKVRKFNKCSIIEFKY